MKKHKVFKRYRKGKRGGQRYHISRKSYNFTMPSYSKLANLSESNRKRFLDLIQEKKAMETGIIGDFRYKPGTQVRHKNINIELNNIMQKAAKKKDFGSKPSKIIDIRKLLDETEQAPKKTKFEDLESRREFMRNIRTPYSYIERQKRKRGQFGDDVSVRKGQEGY